MAPPSTSLFLLRCSIDVERRSPPSSSSCCVATLTLSGGLLQPASSCYVVALAASSSCYIATRAGVVPPLASLLVLGCSTGAERGQRQRHSSAVSSLASIALACCIAAAQQKNRSSCGSCSRTWSRLFSPKLQRRWHGRPGSLYDRGGGGGAAAGHGGVSEDPLHCPLPH